jgi:hypothetical protein
MTITKVTDAGLDRSRIVTPLIINGDMSVAQRGTSATGKTGSGIYAVDRMNLAIDNLGTWTITQETISSGEAYNNGFTKAFRVDCTTADASPSASDNIFFNIKLEGQTLQSIKKGTSNAESLTISFYVKSNKTGTGQVLLQDKDNSRNVGKTYTINSANTWEKKVINFPADTTGAFDNDNAKSLEIEWALDAGSNFTGGTLPATWTSSNNNQRAVNNFSLGDSTDNDWAITGVQLEVGEFDSNTIPSFPFESFDNNLRKCMRYYENFTASGSHKTSTVFGSASARCYFEYKVKKRSTPTVTISQSAGNGANNVSFLTKTGSYVGTIGTHEILNSAIDGFNLNTASGYGSTGWSEGFAVMFYANGADIEVWTADAEL